MLRRSSLLISEGERRYPRQHDRNGNESRGGRAGPAAESRSGNTLDHALDRAQKDPSHQEGDQPERKLEHQPKE